MTGFDKILERLNQLEDRMQKIENNLQHWINNQPESSVSSVITIPVVVHVV